MKSKSVELLPCPFCGGKAERSIDGKMVYCTNCLLGDAALWNTRTPSPSADKLIAAAMEKLIKAMRDCEPHHEAFGIYGFLQPLKEAEEALAAYQKEQ